jgi:hypothetical protein
LDTFKGQIIALTGVVAALYGLWAAIQQFVPKHEAMPSPSSSTARVAQPTNSGNQERRDQSSTIPVPSAPQSTYSTGAEVTVQKFTFKIVGAQLDDHKKENPSLRFTIQITNKSTSNDMIDERVCRFIVDGVPRAPIRDWHAVISAHSAVNVDFVFAFPTETKSAALQIWVGDEFETISVNLPSN